MADIMTKEQRSRNMAKIRSYDTNPEQIAKLILRRFGWYLRDGRHEWGRPDFINKRRKIVVFVDGCFWHKCRFHFTMPKSNVKFWREKIERNVVRDRQVNFEYRKLGYTVIRIWEHELKFPDKLNAKISRRIIQKSSVYPGEGQSYGA
nr:hypothetical protein BdHM001_23350 [Bdellovibrio sp. HM001]